MHGSFGQPALPFAGDGFRLPRIAALQPLLKIDGLCQAPAEVDRPLLVQSIKNLLQLWSQSHPHLGEDFCEHAIIDKVFRQPVAFVTVDAQQVQREKVAKFEPFTGVFDSRPWSTQDLFNLAPLDPVAFPVQELIERISIPGQETVEPCGVCTGSGGAVCKTCQGSAKIICSGCGGAKRVPCTFCSGAGTRFAANGSLVQCDRCNGQGAMRCTQCSGSGQSNCTTCQATGRVRCETCMGQGNLRKSWMLTTRSRTNTLRHALMREPWPIDIDGLLPQADLIEAQPWPWPSSTSSPVPLETWMPADLISWTRMSIDSSLQTARRFDPAQQRLSGLRVQLFGTFVYRVHIRHRGLSETLYVAGGKNRVFSQLASRKGSSFWHSLKHFWRRILVALAMTERYGPEPAFIRAVQKGQVHIADHRCLVPQVAARLQAAVQLTTEGYVLSLTLDTPGTGRTVTVAFAISLEIDAYQELVLCATYRLGPAFREHFPTALKINHSLNFGRVAALIDAATGEEFFAIVDRRPYETISSDRYAAILFAMGLDVLLLISQGALH